MRRTKRQTEFQIGDICTFTFEADRNIPVEVVEYYDGLDRCVWVAPVNPAEVVFCPQIERHGRSVFATNISHLELVYRSCLDEEGIDISSLI